MAKKKKPASKTAPHPKEAEGGPFARQKAFVDERLRALGPKCDDDEHPDTEDERGTHPPEEKGRET